MNKDNQSVYKIDQHGNKCWFLNDRLHREDGPAIEWANGDKSWCFHGQYHRLDGPAIEYADGSKIWYFNDQRHRSDGPAVEYANGKKYWYYHGEYINCFSQKEFKRLLKLKILW